MNGYRQTGPACRVGANKGHADGCIDGTVSARSNATCGQYRRIRERNGKYLLAHGCNDSFGSPLEFVAMLSCGFSQRIAESRGCIGFLLAFEVRDGLLASRETTCRDIGFND